MNIKQMKSNQFVMLILVLSLVIIVGACGGSNNTEKESSETPNHVVNENKVTTQPPVVEKSEEPKIPNPVELTVFVQTGEPDPQIFFMEWYGKYIQKKYPNLSFKAYKSQQGTTFHELLAAGVNIDIVHGLVTQNQLLKETEMVMDISDLIKKHNFDLNRIETAALNSLKNVNDGKLSGLPIELNSYAFYYNRDLFNKFGVDYPDDNMTWEDVLEINKKMTRNEGGVQYYGFGTTGTLIFMDNQLSLPLDDPKTYRAGFNNDEWKRYLQYFIPLLQVTGYENGYNPANNTFSSMFQGVLALIKEKNVAMWAGLSQDYPRQEWDAELMDWAVARFPTIPGVPDAGPQPRTTNFYVTSTGKHHDESFLAIAEFLSDEVQTAVVAERAIGTPLKSDKVKSEFGKSNPNLTGRNMDVLQPKKYAEPIIQTPNTNHAKNEINKAFLAAAAGVKDLNTGLREAEESVNQNAQQLLSK